MKILEKTMSESKEWKPEVGHTAWYFDPNERQVIRAATVTGRSEVNYDHYWLKHATVRHYTLLFPTAEAALASIKVYDLEGNEVVVSRALEVFKEKGAAVILDIFLNEFDVIVQTFRDYRSGEYPLDKFNAYIDRCIKTSDAMKVKAPIYEQELDRIAKLGERPTDERVESDR